MVDTENASNVTNVKDVTKYGKLIIWIVFSVDIW